MRGKCSRPLRIQRGGPFWVSGSKLSLCSNTDAHKDKTHGIFASSCFEDFRDLEWDPGFLSASNTVTAELEVAESHKMRANWCLLKEIQ